MKKYTSYSFIICSIWLSAIFLQGCKTDEQIAQSSSSFGLIQDKILTTSCAVSGCHLTETDGTYGQHNLILAKGKSYQNLVGIDPKNAAALKDGLKRVKPFKSLESLFYHKLIYDFSHHAGKTYGSVMPLGNDLLSVGQIEFIRRWIEAGAPETGNVADASLLDDKTPSIAAFTPLDVPKATDGFQMKLETFEVQPNFEREFFVRKPLGNSQTVYVNKIAIKMRPGSHHFILYGFKNTSNLPTMNQVRDLRNTDGTLNIATFAQMQNHIFNFGGSEANYEYTFPEGTAIELPANYTFDMNSHYFNKGSKPVLGEVYANLYTTSKEKVKNIVKIIDFGNTSLNIPPNKKTVISKNFTFNKDVKIVSLTSHTHKLGEKFEILINGGTRNGEVVYTTTDWEHPDKINFEIPISLKKGEGLTSRITYNNTTNKTVTFGLTSEDEMGIIFGYYYEL